MKTIKILFIFSSQKEGGKSFSQNLEEISNNEHNFSIDYSIGIPTTEQVLWADIIYCNGKMFVENDRKVKELIINHNAIFVLRTTNEFYFKKALEYGVKNILFGNKMFDEQYLYEFIKEKYLSLEKKELAGFN